MQQGALSLDEPANEGLKSWQIPDGPYSKGGAIPVRRLLTHSAGLSAGFYPGYLRGSPIPPSTTSVLEGGTAPDGTVITSEAVRPILEMGKQWCYSGGDAR